MIPKTYFEEFLATTRGPWNTSGKDVQWKLENETLYFQCTRSQSDWEQNFKFWAKPIRAYKNMTDVWRAHAGFVELWKSVEDELKLHLVEMPPKRIVGYSQGAALALLAAEFVEYNFGYQPQVIAFGCPRVFWLPNKKLEKRFDVCRVSTRNDIVTKVPFGVFGYKHIGKELLIGDKRLLWSVEAHTPLSYRLALTEGSNV